MREYMMKVRKVRKQADRILSFLLCVAMVLTMIQVPTVDAYAGIEVINPSGDCGAEEGTITWEYVQNDLGRTLYIRGDGLMPEYDADDLPYKNYIKYTDEVIFEGSIGRIGSNAFANFTDLKKVTFDLTAGDLYIGNNTFKNCVSLTDISFSKGLKINTSSGSFSGCTALETIKIPKDSYVISDGTFANCTGLKNVYIFGDTTDVSTEAFCVYGDNIPNESRQLSFALYCLKGSYADEWAQHINNNEYGIEYIEIYYIDADGNVVERGPSPSTKPSTSVSPSPSMDTDPSAEPGTSTEPGTSADPSPSEQPSTEPGEDPQPITYLARFYDYDETILHEINYTEGTIISAENAPSNPIRSGYRFVKWDPELIGHEMTENVNFFAVYERDVPENDVSEEGLGNSVLYELSDDGVLTISGTGPMKDFAKANDAPWYEDRFSVQSIVIKGKITKIGKNAFVEMPNCQNVSLSGIQENYTIGESAFDGIGAQRISITDKCTEVAFNAFWYANNLRQVEIKGGKIIGYPFRQSSDVTDNLTVSVYNSELVKFEPINVTNFGQMKMGSSGNFGNMMNLVFDSIVGLDNNAANIQWDKVNDLYVPTANQTAFSNVPALKDAGCNVGYIVDNGKAVIHYIGKSDFATQLNLPKFILNYPVTEVKAAVPTGLSILHTGVKHQTASNGICKLCGKKQFETRKGDDGRQHIHNFDPTTTYYIIEISEDDDSEYFILDEDFTLKSGTSLEVPTDTTLIIPDGVTLTIDRGAELILNGVIYVEEGGAIILHGDIRGSGRFKGNGSFKVNPREDTIRFEDETKFYQGSSFNIIVVYIIEYWGVEFEVEYITSGFMDYYEKFTGAFPREEVNPAKWVRVTRSETNQAGVYHYVYSDNGRIIKKRFVVKKKLGDATISMSGWNYGDEAPRPVVSSTTNADSSYIVYYKKADAADDEYKMAVPTLPGDYVAKVVYADNDNFQDASATCNFTIRKRPVNVKIQNETKIYGEENPASFTYNVTGANMLLGSDTLDSIGYTVTCEATQDSDAGDYDIVGTCDSALYDVVTENGILKILPMKAELSISANCLVYDKVYGDEPFMLEGISTVGDGKVSFTVDVNSKAVLDVDQTGKVTIKKAGSGVIHVSLPDTNNAKGARPIDVTVNVAKKVGDFDEVQEVFYLRSRENKIKIDLKDYLPADSGEVDFSAFDENLHVSYFDCDESVFGPISPKIDENGLLTGDSKISLVDCRAEYRIPVTLENYEDGILKLNICFVTNKEVVLAEGETVELVEKGLTYGNSLDTLNFKYAIFVDKDKPSIAVIGKLYFEYPTRKPSYNGGTTTETWKFVPDESYNGLYSTCTGEITFKMYQAEPEVFELPTAVTQTYDPLLTLDMIDLVGGTVNTAGSWEFKNPAQVPSVNDDGYEIVFTPVSQNYKSTIRRISLLVEQADVYMLKKPVADGIVYGSNLRSSSIMDGEMVYVSHIGGTERTFAVRGEYFWDNDSIVPWFKDSDVTEYDVTFKPYDNNYKDYQFKMTIPVSKSGYAPGHLRNSLIEVNADNTVKTVADYTDLPADWIWDPTDAQLEIAAGTKVTAHAVYDGYDKGNYYYETMTYEIFRKPCEIGSEVVYTLAGEIAPSCTTEGLGHKECVLCQEVLESDIIVSALGHDYVKPAFTWSVSENNVDDTTATATFVCKRPGCADTHIGHTVTKDCDVEVTVVDPTCLTDGKITYKASVELNLRYIETKEIAIPMLGHSYEPVFYETEKIAYFTSGDNQGKRKYPAGEIVSENSISENSVDMTCFDWEIFSLKDDAGKVSVSFKCNRDGCDLNIDQHPSAKPVVVTTDVTAQSTATCNAKGIKTYSGCIKFGGYTLDAVKEYQDLERGHHFHIYMYTVQPTCEEEGYEVKQCDFPGCNQIQKFTVPKLGHSFKTLVDKETISTCATHGKTARYKCTRCDKYSGGEDKPLDPKNHEHPDGFEVRNLAIESCLTNGYSGDTYCKACDSMLIKGVDIPMIGKHNWDDGVEIKKPNALENGIKRFTCKTCHTFRNQVLYYEIPKKEVKRTDDTKKYVIKVVADKKNPNKMVVTFVKPKKMTKVVKVPAKVKIDGGYIPVTKIDPKAFKGNKKIEKVVIPATIKELPKETFSGCIKLKTVSVGNGVKTLGKKCFYNCTNLKKVKLGKNVKTIGERCFANCESLTALVIPKKVVGIKAHAFENMYSLKKIEIKSTFLMDKKISDRAFQGLGLEVKIKLPKAFEQEYDELLHKKGLEEFRRLRS